MNTQELINEAVMLPVEDRARLADSLLRSLNPPEAQIDEAWAELASRRLAELNSGKVKGISGQEVFHKIRQRFEK
ncbi:MAG: addiction module protein [Geopsychrobacter sp.]|nr:addiction module protein [Geopsychrobacter sp.]